jgi:small GTP-binding protein
MDKVNQPQNSNSIDEQEYKVELLKDDIKHYDLSFKVVIIGDSSVGKTTLLMKLKNPDYDTNELYKPTIGFEFMSFSVKVNDSILQLQVWDTCGQEIYRSLVTNFYRNSVLAVLVYAVDNENSFESIKAWIEELKINTNDEIRTILIGNKNDLEERKISVMDGQCLANDYGFEHFFETSAKTGQNTKNMIEEIGKILYKDYCNYKKELNEMTISNYEKNEEIRTFTSGASMSLKSSYKKLGKNKNQNKCC